MDTVAASERRKRNAVPRLSGALDAAERAVLAWPTRNRRLFMERRETTGAWPSTAGGGSAGLLGEKGIALETEFATGEVDGAAGRLVSWDEREVPFDLLVTIPLHGGPAFVGRSPGLGDELGFVTT